MSLIAEQEEEAWLPACHMGPRELTPEGYFCPKPQQPGPFNITYQNVSSIQINQPVF